jgi:hypothetical protein
VPENRDMQPEPADLVQSAGGWRDPLGRTNRPFVLLLVLLLVLGIVFFFYTTTTPQLEDSIGYIHAGERLAEGHGPTYEDPNNELAGPYFAMYAFQIRRDDDSRMFLGYPPGYPLLIALGIISTGTETAAHYVVPLMALIGVAFTYLLGRLLSGSDWIGLWSAVLIGLSPGYWQFSTAAWSEIPSTTIMISGLCLYLLSLQAHRTRRQVVLLSVLGGLLIGYSFYIRYSNVVILPAIAAFEIVSKKLSIKNERERWSFFAILGVSVAGILLFNNYYYGGPFLTSYSPEHGWYPNAPFSLSYMFGPSFVGGRSLIEAAKTLWESFPIGLLLVPVGWYFLPRSSRVLTVMATLGFVLLYGLYAFAPTGINSRFLIPAFPFIAISIAQMISTIGQQFHSRNVRRMAGIALFLLLFFPVPKQVRDLEAAEKNSEASKNYAQSLAGRTEPEAVILSYVQNDRLAYYGDRSVLNYRRIPLSDPEEERFRLEMLEPCLVESVDRLLQKEIPVYYIEDSSPPFWNSLAILRENYDLVLIGESPAMYLISNSDARSNQADDSIPYSCEVLP